MSGQDAAAHWRTVAAQWARLASPLRPCAEDICIIEEMLAAVPAVLGAAGKGRAWLLGITSEIAAAPCLQDIDLIAVERVRAMIDAAWPGNTDRRRAICGDWARAPFADGSFDLAIGDGCLMVAGFPDELSQLLASVHRCLHRDGHLMLRLFCRPDIAETPDAVIAALLGGEIDSFHAFKWRLGMAVQGIDDAPDVAVDAIWRIWSSAQIDASRLAQERGWPLATVRTMDFYRGSSARYNFMRYDETISHLQRAGFDLLATRSGHYELASCCPHVLLRKGRQGS